MKEIRIVFWTLIIFGLTFLAGGVLLCANVFDYSGTEEATAIITDFESYREHSAGHWRTYYKTHLKYEVHGQSYTNVAKMYSSKWDIGEEIEIYYDIKNPQIIGSKQTDLASLVVPCLGLLFFCFGIVLMLISRKKEKALKEIGKSTENTMQ